MQLATARPRPPAKKRPATSEKLIHEYLPYVKRIVQRIANHLPASVDVEDLMNVGVMGLIQAVDRFDPKRDNKFMTYAIFRIKGAVLSELRSRDFLSRSSRRKLRELEQTCQKMEQRLGREVEDVEVAAELGIDLEDLHRTRQMSSISFISFEELGLSSRDEKEKLMNFLIHNEEDALSQTRLRELRSGLARAIEQLPEKERLVMSLYYLDELNMKETGEVMHITESRVSQIHSQAIMRLRKKLRKEQLLDDD
ncbi:MAG: FliA/WhiG family RNA polymerase sigma factor [Deltaproteobacteria bacterium]|nr:FliA/WhiG family RNA polymerase sigma factor [Deltaproteobacteria bacterium]